MIYGYKHNEIEGLYLIEPQVFGDERGYFLETYSSRDLESLIGPVDFVQDNESMSCYGVVRGLHFQRAPYTQAKMVRCVSGRVLDVAVDIRKGSPTFLSHVAVELSGENHRMFYIPKGFAHGFSVLSDKAVFQYKCDEYYHPESDSGFQLLDPRLGIDWMVPEDKMILSDKDRFRALWTEEDCL